MPKRQPRMTRKDKKAKHKTPAAYYEAKRKAKAKQLNKELKGIV